jgi:hypothetical protein
MPWPAVQMGSMQQMGPVQPLQTLQMGQQMMPQQQHAWGPPTFH